MLSTTTTPGQKIVAIAGAFVAFAYVLLARVAFPRLGHPARAFGITTLVIAGGFMLPANIAYFFYVGPQSAHIRRRSRKSGQVPSFRRSSSGCNDAWFPAQLRHRRHRGDAWCVNCGIRPTYPKQQMGRSRVRGFSLHGDTPCGEIWSKHRAVHYQEVLLAARGAA
jgi:hypothetical protein